MRSYRNKSHESSAVFFNDHGQHILLNINSIFNCCKQEKKKIAEAKFAWIEK